MHNKSKGGIRMMTAMNSTLTQPDKEKDSSLHSKQSDAFLKLGHGESWYSEENTKRYAERFADRNGQHK